ncbi:XdhC family protein [Fontisubflavum oceani]|uniref:XdhC family protein n=1 Tax=Fontisubflavum oceani TaxID=2978973 RepID=UPI0025B37F07|nr:XdhC/CoxI family protein [Fontisubflavum oceani]WJY20588.1 XdhC family protein [Fontisubflavum oceani]
MAESGERMPELALEWHRAGKGAVLATVVETWGSAPRRAGSQLVVSSEGEMEGSVSGGCVEGAVVVEAMEALEAGDAQLLEFGVSDDEAFAVGLACGGTIKVLVEPVGRVLPVEMLEALVDARAARQAVAYVVDVTAGTRQLVAAGDPEVADRVRADRSGLDGDRYIGIHNPPLRMVVVGAVHIAQALLPMARMAGYDPVLVDPRPAFAAEARFPGERILEAWPDEALTELGLDARTAVVTLTHDPKLDDPAIEAALASDVFYLGCLGSSRTHGKRVARLTEAGIAEDVIARIHAPVGLDIGAQNPAEIAVAIMAEITRRLRQG